MSEESNTLPDVDGLEELAARLDAAGFPNPETVCAQIRACVDFHNEREELYDASGTDYGLGFIEGLIMAELVR